MIPIVKFRTWWFAISALVLIASIVAVAVWGIKFGTDFTGGSLLEVRFGEATPSSLAVHTTLDPLLERDFVVQATDTASSIIRMEPLEEDGHQAVLTALRETYGSADELRFDSIGPVIGQELARKSMWAIVIIFIAIVFYVAAAFRKVTRPVSAWKYGVITIATGIHDVIVPLGLFSVLGHFYGTEVNAAFVAAVLTILGYSINDTIVIFDRVRENLGRSGSMAFADIVEISLHQTMARSLNTGLAALLALIAIYFFGGATVHDFALALIVGIAVGTYSSIFIAGPLLVSWQGRGDKQV